MELMIDLTKVLSRADQVTIGEEYYFFDEIRPHITDIYFEKGKLTAVTDDVEHPFESGDTAYSYACPVPKKKKRPMTFYEIVNYWKEHRTEIYHFADEPNNDFFMINGFERYTVDYTPKAVIYINDSSLDYYTFINDVVREDGTKFEVEVEDEN